MKKSPKIVQLAGQLGNQMFQYAFAKALEKRWGCEVLFDKSLYEDENANLYALHIFNLNLQFATNEQIALARQRNSKLPGFLRKIFGIKKYNIAVEPQGYYCYYNKKFLFDKDYLLYVGFFQNEKYFSAIATQIKQDFRFPPIRTDDDYTQERMQKIQDCENSVFIHIRRGDYTNYGWELEKDYYRKAVKYMLENIKNPKFFVFGATDLEYIKSFNIGCEFEDLSEKIPTSANFYEDMRLMSHCKHGILANSTYSWWAAWLSNNGGRGQTFIAPSPWILNRDDIICSNWIKIQRNCEKGE